MSFEINITPTARLLRMIGNFEMKGWQCIAELIDNSIDGLIDTKLNNKKIDVYIPTDSEIKNNSKPISVEDNGKGMNNYELENALTAGSSSRDSTGENLGLFGVGFNIASARLGDKVKVRTSQKDMDHDIVTTIDLIALQDKKRQDKTTRVTAKKEPKTFDSSGTKIQVYDYIPRTKSLLRNRKNIKEAINEAYSASLFDRHGITLMINGDIINPYRFCIWNKNRSVKHAKHGDIPAYFNIEKTILEKAYYSKKYETYIDADTANNMDKSEVIVRNIEIEGWVGIQRFLDPKNYGINIIRNGRIILKLEKDKFFNWHNPDHMDPDTIMKHTKYWKGTYVEEYPIDQVVLGGRIVGEIHANFIHPNYTKDNLENEQDSSWLKVVRELRGAGPFQPDLNAALGYEQNLSPLSLLYQGFRKPHPPGKKTLIGGDRNKKALHPKARTMAAFFFDGKAEYQDDSKWYEMVLEAEITKDPDEEEDVTNTTIDENSGQDDNDDNPENEFPNSKKIDEKTYDIQSYINERPINVDIYEYMPKEEDANPIIFRPKGYAEFNAYINMNNDLFRDFTDEWEDLILLEVASMFQNRKADKSSFQLSSIYYELKKKYQRDSMLDVNMLVNDSKSLVEEMQTFLVESKQEVNISLGDLLNDEELKVLKNNYLKIKRVNLDNDSLNELIQDSSYLEYMELKYIFKYISLLPEQILDGNFFNFPYNTLDEEQKQEYLDEYLGYLNDVKWFIYTLQDMSPNMVKEFKDMMIRNRFGLQYLNQQRN